MRRERSTPFRYDVVTAMLLNEFLTEHKAFLEEKLKVQELEANAARQQSNLTHVLLVCKECAHSLNRADLRPDNHSFRPALLSGIVLPTKLAAAIPLTRARA